MDHPMVRTGYQLEFFNRPKERGRGVVTRPPQAG